MNKLLKEFKDTKELNRDKRYQKLFSLLQKANKLQDKYIKELSALKSKSDKMVENNQVLEMLIADICKDLSLISGSNLKHNADSGEYQTVDSSVG